MSRIYAQQKRPGENAAHDPARQAEAAFSNQAMLDLLKAPENVRAKPLSQEMNEKMSQHFGVSLSGIKVFENENLNQLGETAFAHGNEIHVAKGQYAPGTAHGQEVLMHEAAHVVQQGMGLAHDTGNESAALEAQAQSGSIMGNAATFSMPTATAAAPVQAFGGRLLKKIKEAWGNSTSMLHPFKRHRAAKAALTWRNHKEGNEREERAIGMGMNPKRARELSKQQYRSYPQNPLERHYHVEENLQMLRAEYERLRSDPYTPLQTLAVYEDWLGL